MVAGHKRIAYGKNGAYLLVCKDVRYVCVSLVLGNPGYITRKTNVVHVLGKLCQYGIFAANRLIAVISQGLSPFVYQCAGDERGLYLFLDEEPVKQSQVAFKIFP